MKKATGIDGISAKIVKLSHKQILNTVTNIVIFCLSENVFSDRMKLAQKVPLYKKKKVSWKGIL